MTRIIMAAVAVALAATGADAAARKGAKGEARVLQSAQVAAHGYAAYGYAVANRPAWAAPGECYTDEGYGRFSPCSSGPCGK
jgi:hypothetical protein